jgi:hypothetical protein
MATGLSVNVQEFDTYDFKGDATQELIFSLKEARNTYDFAPLYTYRYRCTSFRM